MTTTNAWNASTYQKNVSFVYNTANTAPILALLDVKEGEKVLDLACGSGELTLELERAVGQEGLIVGFDASESMISAARKNGLKNLFVSDAQALIFPAEWSHMEGKFDAVFTSAALHWCKRDPPGVMESAKRALKKGGRFVGEFGGYLNCVGLRSAIYQVLKRRGIDPVPLDPWYFPSVEEYSALLRSAGFTLRHISLNPRITSLPRSLVPWLETFVRSSFLTGLKGEEAEEIMKEIEGICEVDSKDAQGNWSLMYVRLRFVAVLE